MDTGGGGVLCSGAVLEDEDEVSGYEDLDHIALQVTSVAVSSSEPVTHPHAIPLT